MMHAPTVEVSWGDHGDEPLTGGVQRRDATERLGGGRGAGKPPPPLNKGRKGIL